MFIINLRFFDGAGAAGAPAAAPAGAPAAQTAPAAAPQEAAPEAAAVDRKAEYAKFKAEYKDMYAEDFNGQLNDRLKVHKANEKRLKALDPILTAVASKYGIDPTDTEGLQKAIDADETLYEREAEEQGLTVAQLKRQKQLETEIKQYRQQQEAAERDALTQQNIAKWTEEGQQTKALYPDFDFTTEARSPETGEKFQKLVKQGLVSVLEAYELVHPEARNQRIQRGTAMVAQITQQQTIDTIKAKGMRPAENGAGGAAAAVKVDVAKMTPEQRREYNMRAMRGEKIDLRTVT